MNYSKMFEYKSFDFFDTDPCIELCYELAYEQLEKFYLDKKIDSCDCFGLYIFDKNSDYVVQYTTGRLGKVGPLAMRNESTKEVFVLCQN